LVYSDINEVPIALNSTARWENFFDYQSVKEVHGVMWLGMIQSFLAMGGKSRCEAWIGVRGRCIRMFSCKLESGPIICCGRSGNGRTRR
jgi:hypothetical protein